MQSNHNALEGCERYYNEVPADREYREQRARNHRMKLKQQQREEETYQDINSLRIQRDSKRCLRKTGL